MKKIAIIGYGALSHIFLDVYVKYLTDDYTMAGIYTRSEPEEKNGYNFFSDIDQLIAAKPDYVLEFAGVGALKEYGEKILGNGINLVAVSIGALADEQLFESLRRTAKNAGCKLHLSSGAIGGFDVLRTMALAGVDKITIENFKAPASLNGAPFLNGKALPEDREMLIFDGSAREAISSFPKNVNVAVAAALACADVDQAEVLINSIPGRKNNTHLITAENSMASVKMEFTSHPDPVNPKSSTITAWSVAALLKNLTDSVEFF